MFEEYTGKSGVYLLHFDSPVGHAEHYMGYADDICLRVASHARGTSGARLPSTAFKRGIGFVIARVWEGATEADEARMKARRLRKASPAMRNNHKRGTGVKKYCPICKEIKKNGKQ